MNSQRWSEIESHMERGKTPTGEPPTIDELYAEVLNLRDYFDDLKEIAREYAMTQPPRSF